MQKRAVIVMRSERDGKLTREVADDWGIPCKPVEHPLAWSVQLAILKINEKFYNNFMDMSEVYLDEENAAMFMMNLRLKQDDGNMIALWFSDDLEESIRNWHVSSRAFNRILLTSDEVVRSQKEILELRAPFDVEYLSKAINIDGFFRMVKVDLEAIDEIIMRELRSAQI